MGIFVQPSIPNALHAMPVNKMHCPNIITRQYRLSNLPTPTRPYRMPCCSARQNPYTSPDIDLASNTRSSIQPKFRIDQYWQ